MLALIMEKPVANNSDLVLQQASAQAAPQPALQPVVIPPPLSNAPKPDKTVSVPKYFHCMAGDATPKEGAIHAVNPKETSE